MTSARQRIHITGRESEILGMIARGMSNQQIADVLGISVNTVRSHAANIRLKYRVNTRAELALAFRKAATGLSPRHRFGKP